jgi:hypothetical protein
MRRLFRDSGATLQHLIMEQRRSCSARQALISVGDDSGPSQCRAATQLEFLKLLEFRIIGSAGAGPTPCGDSSRVGRTSLSRLGSTPSGRASARDDSESGGPGHVRSRAGRPRAPRYRAGAIFFFPHENSLHLKVSIGRPRAPRYRAGGMKYVLSARGGKPRRETKDILGYH